MTFDLSTTLSWTDIISAATAIFTFLAVIVAVISNRNANKSLKYSLKIQEQSKNIDLYDKRLGIIKSINKFDINTIERLPIVLLFDESIVEIFDKCCVLEKELEKACTDKEEYEIILEKRNFQHGRQIITDLSVLEKDVFDAKCCDDSLKNFKELCDQNILLNESPSLNGRNKKDYNYFDITNRIHNFKRALYIEKEKLCENMEYFIKKSIETID